MNQYAGAAGFDINVNNSTTLYGSVTMAVSKNQVVT